MPDVLKDIFQQVDITNIGEKNIQHLLLIGAIDFNHPKHSYYVDVQKSLPFAYIRGLSFPKIDAILYPGNTLNEKKRITIRQGSGKKRIYCYPYKKGEVNTFQFQRKIKEKRILLFTDVLKSGYSTTELYTFIREKKAIVVGIYILFDRGIEAARMIRERFGHISNHIQALSTVHDLLSVLEKAKKIAEAKKDHKSFKCIENYIDTVMSTLK